MIVEQKKEMFNSERGEEKKDPFKAQKRHKTAHTVCKFSIGWLLGTVDLGRQNIA
ncbi:hypothetical protein DY000_02014000 [Brassica cretica]|uniref:Uncharacterized protein n=1 Tax=Brassica cretica TaxID=69181 RepID=A0ABQ7CRH3_BRACR|nr:hypothetical protein DY000_02014000 [Brassica cretica]